MFLTTLISVMSVAKPTLEYVHAIETKLDLTRVRKAFSVIGSYQKKHIHLLIAVVLLSILRSYLFTLEPLYTAQIIDEVCTRGQYNLLPDLVLKILFVVIAFAFINFVITFVQGANAQAVIRDIRVKYYDSLQAKSFGLYDSSAIGDLISRATMDLQAVDMFFRTWIGVVCDPIFMLAAIIMVIKTGRFIAKSESHIAHDLLRGIDAKA